MLGPDTIVESVIGILAVHSFSGVVATDFWPLIETQLGREIDSFTRHVVWNWLLKDTRFLVKATDISNGSGGRKPKAKFITLESDLEFETVLQNKYILQVTDDYQSVYLTGMKAKDNILGKMPYDLLRIIAKHGSNGVNSIDLIKESKQDPRSLTNRLQVLEDNQVIVKMGVYSGKYNTNIMYHFRFLKNNTIIISDFETKDKTNNDPYDRYLIITYIMKALKSIQTETPVRLTRDLFEELKVFQQGLKLRWFNGILRFLVVHGYVEMIQVEHGEKKRFFPAIRYLKDLPPSTSKSELMLKIKEQERLDEMEANNLDVALDEVETPIPKLHRYLPIVNQIRDTIVCNEGSMISNIENILTSIYKTKQLSNLIENIMCTNDKQVHPGQIVGQMVHSGKVKMYKLMSYDHWCTTQNKFNKAENQNGTKISSETSQDLSLMEINAEYSRSFNFDRKIDVLEFADAKGEMKTFIMWKGRKNPLWRPVTKKMSIYEGLLKSIEDIIEIRVSKEKVEIVKIDKTSFFNKYQKMSTNIATHNELHESVISQAREVADDVTEIITVKPDVEGEQAASNVESNSVIDLGPARRRNILLEEVNKKKCVCICVEFCNILSSRLNLDYLIDRRTLIRDANVLHKEKKVEAERFEDRKYIVKSTINKPTYEDILRAVKDSPKKDNKTRKFMDKVSFHDIVIFDEKNLKRGLKFPDQESRLKVASERNKEFINETGRVVKRSKRKRREITEKESEDESPSIYDKNETTENDLIGPIMDKRKRKKFKPNNKQQARVVRAFKKMRTSIKMKEEHILLFIKAIVVTQSLSSGATIDWPKVASIFDEAYTSETLRRMWPRYKKLLGFKNVTQARKNWEAVLMLAIEKKLVTERDLLNYDIFKMLDLWTTEGTEIFMSKNQRVIFRDYASNFKGQHFELLKEEIGIEVYKEPPSLIEKEQVWTTKSFCFPTNAHDDVDQKYIKEAFEPSLMQLAKIKLKALFATSGTKFSGPLVKELFQNIPKEIYSSALTELEDQKAIAFLGEESNIKFTLTDKVLTILDCKLTPEFLDSAKNFEQVLKDVDTSHTGILLSATSPIGIYAPLFNYIANNAIMTTRIDQKPLPLDSYSTKSRDRSKLESDFLLSHFNDLKSPKFKNVKPKVGAPCSSIWIDLQGDFNTHLWKKCVCVILWEIIFSPGTKIGPLCRRVTPLLEPSEVLFIISWMKDRKCIIQDGEGFWASSNWYNIFWQD